MNTNSLPPLDKGFALYIDPGVHYTGICVVRNGEPISLITAVSREEFFFRQTLSMIREISAAVHGLPIGAVVIEDYGYNIGKFFNPLVPEIVGVLRDKFGGIPFIMVPPSTIKKHAAGSGRATKAQVTTEQKRFNPPPFRTSPVQPEKELRALEKHAYDAFALFRAYSVLRGLAEVPPGILRRSYLGNN